MALVLTDVGAQEILNAYFNSVYPVGGKNLSLRLFVNNHTPTDTDTAASYTEAAGGGYAAIPLNNGSWVATILSGIPQAAYAQQAFTFTGSLTGGATIYGYFVLDASGTLFCAELLSAPFTPSNNGDQLQITPTFQMSHGTPAD